MNLLPGLFSSATSVNFSSVASSSLKMSCFSCSSSSSAGAKTCCLLDYTALYSQCLKFSIERSIVNLVNHTDPTDPDSSFYKTAFITVRISL